MAGTIPQDFIDELLARVDIVDVISARVPLKKTGREFSACCPFHDREDPVLHRQPGQAVLPLLRLRRSTAPPSAS